MVLSLTENHIKRKEAMMLTNHRKTKRQIFEDTLNDIKTATNRKNVDLAIKLTTWLKDKLLLAESAEQLKIDLRKAAEAKRIERKKAQQENRKPCYKGIPYIKPLKVSRGEVWQCELGQNIGSEQNESRPVLIIQNDVTNTHSPNTIIAPLTSLSNRSDKKGATLTPEEAAEERQKLRANEVLILPEQHAGGESTGIAAPSVLMCQNIKEVNKMRLQYRITLLDPEVMKEVDIAIRNSLGLE